MSLTRIAVGCTAMVRSSDHLCLREQLIIASGLASASAWPCLLYANWAPGICGFVRYGRIGLGASGSVQSDTAANAVCAPTIAGIAIALVNTGLFLGAAILQRAFCPGIDPTRQEHEVDGLRRSTWCGCRIIGPWSP
ncbi:MAG: hypothetical protein H6954_03445 [Chromatiaceae bacterium]|nr:hypothetical protein [Chromatiaceae bacterium]